MKKEQKAPINKTGGTGSVPAGTGKAPAGGKTPGKDGGAKKK